MCRMTPYVYAFFTGVLRSVKFFDKRGCKKRGIIKQRTPERGVLCWWNGKSVHKNKPEETPAKNEEKHIEIKRQ